MTRRDCLSKVVTALGIATAGPWLQRSGWAQAPGSSPTLAEAVEAIRQRSNVPALATAAWIDGSIVATEVTGHRKLGDNKKVTATDRWHIGSCTKSMTASLAGILVEQGRLKWDTTVGEVLGRSLKTRPEWHPVTLEQLLQHRGGAPGKPPDDLWAAAWKQNGSNSDQRRAFAEGIMRKAPLSAPGERYEYSNQGYAIAGVMMEAITRKAWEDLLRQHLFAPLEMKSAGFGAPGKAGRVDEPLGHGGDSPLKPEEPGPAADNPPAIGPAGTVHCSITDLARYAGWHADEGQAARWKLKLKPENFVRLHTPPNGGDYASGWIATERQWAGGRVLTHNGSNTIWYATMWVAPLKKSAFVAATNTASKNAATATDEAVAELIGRFLKLG